MTAEHPLDLIRRYYAGCNTADRSAMQATFCDDVVHYFTHHAPVRGAAALAEHWARMQPRIAGYWTVDHGIVQGDEAVIEWTLRWTPPGGAPELMRGAEWYRLRDRRIAEIRAYYLNRHAPFERRHFELDGFDYAGRGYPVLAQGDFVMTNDCPRCAVPLAATELQQVPVARCPQCRGLWFEAHALRAARDAADPDLAFLEVELWSDAEQFRHAPRSGRCPTGDGSLHALEYGHTGVTVDYCDACFGVWLDQAEFERIVTALEHEVDTRPAPEYLRAALHEARQLLTGPQPLLEEWRDLRTVLKLLEYRVLSEHPGLHQRLLALQASNPFR